jgi:hypothetical protein
MVAEVGVGVGVGVGGVVNGGCEHRNHIPAKFGLEVLKRHLKKGAPEQGGSAAPLRR